MPPAQKMYLLPGSDGHSPKHELLDFFPLGKIKELKIITMEAFLEREGRGIRDGQLTNIPRDLHTQSPAKLWSFLWTQSFKPTWRTMQVSAQGAHTIRLTYVLACVRGLCQPHIHTHTRSHKRTCTCMRTLGHLHAHAHTCTLTALYFIRERY